MLDIGINSLVIDLSHPLGAISPSYPGDPILEVSSIAQIPSDGYALHQWSSNFHIGTHIDAPSHFINDGRTILDLDASYWIGDAWVIDVPKEPSPALAHLLENPPPPSTSFLLIRSGWDQFYGTSAYYDQHPCWKDDLTDWICGSSLKGVGMDTPSPDTSPYPVHKKILGAGKILIENMHNLSRVPKNHLFTLLCIPLPVSMEASWVRPLAILPKDR